MSLTSLSAHWYGWTLLAFCLATAMVVVADTINHAHRPERLIIWSVAMAVLLWSAATP